VKQTLRFTKMQGLGNDFVVIDATKEPLSLSTDALRQLADRHFGVGCDQILVVDPPPHAGVDFGYRIFNADGGEVEQCGNGARCFVKFVRQQGLSDKRAIRVQTAGGVIEPRLEPGGEVTVDMGAPRFSPAEVPFSTGSHALVQALEVDGRSVDITALSMGNPHAVQVVGDVDAAPVSADGPRIERHARFPQGVNAGFLQVVDRATIRLRVWERGVGETLACGTGACAAAVTAIVRGLCDSPVQVVTRGGPLTIAWDGPGTPVMMTGAAETVFEGEWTINDR
jgi:diaminopimelate epimerase